MSGDGVVIVALLVVAAAVAGYLLLALVDPERF
ncbi:MULTISPECIES: potassium-transporting ATPase subunit F [Gordonia]|nr:MULTISPECIES: potassium-transporting ATPase subunit F [Gordonia]NNG98282.1 potassium-transporting ATPase subunit F [Gordonia araii NBRC 100433]